MSYTLLGPPLVNRISPSVRKWLMVIILLYPLAASFARAWGPKDPHVNLTYGLIAGSALVWLTVLTYAFYIGGIYPQVMSALNRFKWIDVPLGFIFFVLLRAFSVVIMIPVVIWMMKNNIHHPNIIQTMSLVSLAKNPIKMLVIFTALTMSAGFFEELWRFGMFQCLRHNFPKLYEDDMGKLAIIGVVSAIFGLGHLYEGWLGIGTITIIGFILGSIMVYRDSFWQASIAHFFTDATVGFLLFLIAVFMPSVLELAAKS